MNWSEWVDLDGVKAISQHLSSTIAAAVTFWAAGLLFKWTLPDKSLVKPYVDDLEQLVLLGLLLWFTIQLAVLLWKKRIWKAPNVNLLVA